ncbi:MAG: caspase family protein [Verrucomicrobiaceae bacterium]
MKSLVLLICLAALPLAAAERVALVIGNDAYQYARPLETAVNDASAVAGALQKLGFDTLVVPNAGLERTVEAMETLKAKAAGAQAVLVYYAGHGVESGGANYLVPVDAKLEREIQLKTQAVSLDTLLDEMKQMNVPARMVILDCCRDNPLEGRSWLATRAVNSGGLAALNQDMLNEATLVVFSASPGKPALDRVTDSDTHSPFTQALLDQLPQPGVHSFEVFGRVEENVIRLTEGRQQPRLFYNGSTLPFREFRFAQGQPGQPAPMPVAPAVVVSTPPAPPPAAAGPQLPAAGFFDLDTLFIGGPYAGYNRYSRSAILKQAQELLKVEGLYLSRADGAPGPGTQTGLISWQRAHGVPVTGRLDTSTLTALSLVGIREQQPPAPARPVQSSAPARSTPKPPPPPSKNLDQQFIDAAKRFENAR